MAFPDGCGLLHQDNAPCHEPKMFKKSLKNSFQVLTWPPNFRDLNPVDHLWDVQDKQIYFTPHHTNILLPDDTAHLQGASGDLS